MASREVKFALENLHELAETVSAAPLPSVDDDARQYVAQIASSCLADTGLRELSVIVPMLVQGENSLCGFIQRVIGTTFAGTIDDALGLLQQLLELAKTQTSLKQHLLLVVKDLRDTNFMVWNSKQSTAKNRAAAVEVLSELVNLVSDTEQIGDLDVPKLLTEILSEIRRTIKKLGVTIKQPAYKFLGVVAHKAPLLAEGHAESMFNVFFTDMQTEMKSKKDPKYATIAGCLEGLTGFLYNFANLECCASNLEIIFTNCRKIIGVTDASRYAMICAALKLLSRHADKFTKHLLDQKNAYKEMYVDLTRWAAHTNRDAQKLGYAALDTFLKVVSRSIVLNCKQKTNNAACNSAFNFFITEFNEKVKTADTTRELTLAVRGYGYFAAPCRLLSSPDHMASVLSEMIYKSEQMFFSSSGDINENKLMNLPSFIDTLANMIHDGGSRITDVLQHSLQRFCLLIMDVFPRLAPPQQHFGCKAIAKVFLVVTSLSASAAELVTNIVYQALVQSCSYPIPPAGDGSSDTVKKPTSFIDFIPMWEKLVSCEYMKDLMEELDASEVDLFNTAKMIFDEFTSATLRIIQSLDFRLLAVEQEDHNTAADLVSVDKKPSKEQDFQIFYSLEHLVSAILAKSKKEFYAPWIRKFCGQIITISKNNPLVGGLYRLLSFWWRCEKPCMTSVPLQSSYGQSSQDVEMTDDRNIDSVYSDNANVSSFIRELIGRMQHFSDEVLISALQAILDAPIYALKQNSSILGLPLVLALQTGKSYLPLADATISALRRWCFSKEIPLSLLQPCFPQVLPLLDSYLRGTTQDVFERSKVAAAGKSSKKLPKLVVDQAETALARIREQTLSFLGELGGKYNHMVLGVDVFDDVRNHAIAWDMEQHLQFSFPFVDMVLGNFFLDDFLPLVCDICMQSPDRPTKVAACELLHSMTVFLVGTHKNMSSEKRDKSTLMNLIAKLVPKLLELACDVEPVTKQMFEPLVLQMIHWFSRHAEKASAESAVILDCIMDGLVNERNSTMRDFSARCVREYLEWSTKTAAHRGEVSVAVASLFDKIISFAEHSNSSKRFGAALAFNQCYKIFREDSAAVDIFTVDLVITFTKSLAMSHRDNPGFEAGKLIESCLDHLGRIVEKYAKELNKSSPRRRTSVDLPQPTVGPLVEWLLLQSCRPETLCRVKSWSLVDKFTAVLDKSAKAGYYFDELLKRKGISWLLKAFLNGGNDPDMEDRILKPEDIAGSDGISAIDSTSVLERVAATLDCFTWSFQKVYIKPESVGESAEWKSFDLIIAAVSKNILLSTAIKDANVLVHLQYLKCSILVRITDLLMSLLTKYGRDGAKIIPKVIWTVPFLDSLIRTTLDAVSVGFDLNDSDVKNGLPQQMRLVLKTVVKFGDGSDVQKLRDVCSDLTSKDQYDVLERLHDGSLDNVIVDGFITLHEVGLDTEYLKAKHLSLASFSESLVNFVQKSLRSKHKGCGARKNAWLCVDVTQERLALKLALNFSPETKSIFDIFVFNTDYRDVFYPKLKKVIFKCLFSASNELNKSLEGFLDGLFDRTALTPLEWTSRNEATKDLLDYVLGNRDLRKRSGQMIVKLVMQHYGTFVSVDNNHVLSNAASCLAVLEALRRILLIDSTVLKATSTEVFSIVSFYVSVLRLSSTLGQAFVALKNHALSLLPFFLVGHECGQVEEAIEQMYVNDFPVKASELPKDSIQSSYYLKAIELILSAADLSRNFTVVQICAKLVCRDEDHPLLERIQKTFETISGSCEADELQRLLDVPWDIFTNVEYDIEPRRIAVQKVLLPMLRATAQAGMVEFYSRNLEDIVQGLEMKQKVVTKEFLVAQTWYFGLLELLCSSVPKEELIEAQSSLAVSFWTHRSQSNPAQDRPKGPEFIQFITRSADTIAHENVPGEPGLEETRRELHCAAYKTLVAAITATQTDLRFYWACFFQQNPEKGRIVWANLVDQHREYIFPVEFVQAPKKRQQLAAIHKEIVQDENGSLGSSLSSGIFTMTSYASSRAASASLIQESSLADELGRFDYSNGLDRTSTPLSAFRKAKLNQRITSGMVTLEVDDLNSHECMPTLVALVRHMIEKKVTPLESPPPNWVASLRDELGNSQTSTNVKLFLAKLMVNVENSEQPYFLAFADQFYGPVIELILTIDCSEGINYFVVDLVHMMLMWTLKNPPQQLNKTKAQELFVFIIKHITHSNSQVKRNNLTLLKILTESWRDLLHHPAGSVVTSLLTADPTKAKDNITVINVIAILLDARLPLTPAVFEEYRRILVLHTKMQLKSVYTVSALTLGLLIVRGRENEISQTKIDGAVADCKTILNSTLDSRKDQFLTILHEIQKSYVEVIEQYLPRILYMAPALVGDAKAKCIEILTKSARKIRDPYTEFKSRGFKNALSDRNEAVQGLTLQLFSSVLDLVSAGDVLDFLPDLRDLFNHKSPLLRQQSYEFSMQIYELFESRRSEEEKQVLEAARAHLFVGLKDRDKTIRDMLTRFWADEKRLSGSTFARLLTVFENLITPELESSFLFTSCHLLLDLCQNSPFFNEPLFKQSLTDCEYFKQEIETSWKQRASMTPVTSSTFSSGTFSGTYGSARVGERAPKFTPTQMQGTTAMDTLAGSAAFTYASQFSQSLMIDLPHRDFFMGAGGDGASQLSQADIQEIEAERTQKELQGIRRRFQRDNQEQSKFFFASRELNKQKEREQQLKDEREKRNLDVKLTRSYRIGDVPDIQITFSALIQPLQILSQYDAQIASLLLVRLFEGIVEDSRKHKIAVDDSLERLAHQLDGVLKDKRVSDAVFLTTLLKILNGSSKLLETVSVQAMMVAALKSQQPHLGITAVENSVMREAAEPQPKRGQKHRSGRSQHWLALFQLFESIGEIDSIRGLQLDQIFRKSEDVASAIDAESRGDYSAAAISYHKIYADGDEDAPVSQVLLESYMRCVDELGRWKDLEKIAVPADVADSQEGNLENIWDNSHWVESVMPFAIRCKLKLAFDNDEEATNSLATFFNNALEIPQRNLLLERNYAYELALFCLRLNKRSEAEYYLKTAGKNFLEDWAGAQQLNRFSRRKQLPKMQLIEEMRKYIVMLTDSARVSSTEVQLAQEYILFLVDGDREPALMDSVSVWNDLITNRCFFAKDLEKKVGQQLNSGFIATFTVHEKLKVANAAVNYHNFTMADRILSSMDHVARKAFPDSAYFSSDDFLPRLEDRWSKVYVEAAVYRSQRYSDLAQAKPSLTKLFSALKLTDRLISKTADNTASLMHFLQARVLSSTASVLSIHGSSVALDPADQKLLGLDAGKPGLKPLYVKIFEQLETACHSVVGSSSTAAFLEMFRYCDWMLGKNFLLDDQLVPSGTKALLIAVKLGSVEARDLFCRLLVWLSEYPELITETFITESAEIPAWMFLTWTNQMLALVDKKEGAAVSQLLLKLAAEYPQALVYGFKISKEGYVFDDNTAHGRRNRITYDQLTSLLNIPVVDEFVRQLEQLYEPHSFFTDFIKKAEYMLREKKHNQLKREFEGIYQRLFAEQAASLNSTWKNFVEDFRDKILSVFGREGKKIPKMTLTQFKTEKQRLEDLFKGFGGKEKLTYKARMADVNPWLAQFSAFKFGNKLEIPGQYDGREKPQSELHVTIVSFGDEVRTMVSVRKPKRIVIRGDDEKDYPFLVKGGEDLRLDQRIEQLFTLMNRIFDQDADCAKRNLRIKTYRVVPMTSQVGLIEWVQNSMQLREFLSKNQPAVLDLLTTAREAMQAKLTRLIKPTPKGVDAKRLYHLAYQQIGADQMRNIFQEIEKTFDPYLLRRQLQKLTVSPEAFVIVRSLFAEAFGALTIGQYLLGIGDRHLSNYMVSSETGTIFPIDFGHAFGSATQFLPIPELVPIRMTRQFVNLMAPLSKSGKVQQTMVHAMRALRNDRQILLATMNVFIQEPSVDWLQNARKCFPSEDSPPGDLNWFPREKIAMAERKLVGGNPAFITVDEIKRGPITGETLQKLEEIVIGETDGVRGSHPADGLSVEAQIECLMDQATDGNILGRVYFGWDPWM